MSLADIRGILFDKDGTLVDFQATWFAIGDRMAMRSPMAIVAAPMR